MRSMLITAQAFLLLMLSGSGFGCDSSKTAGHAAPAAATTLPAKEPDLRTVAAILAKQGSSSPGESAPAALPPGHPPMGGATPPAKSGDGLPAGHPAVGGGAGGGGMAAAMQGALTIKYDAPPDWKPVQPSSAMRKAQFTLPRAEGDAEDGQLIVFYFGPGQGGSVSDNINRWKGMFSTSEGKPVPDDKVKLASSTVDGMKLTTLDVAGRYSDQMGRADKPGATDQEFRMLAAIAEAPDGLWFFKAVGPAKTMASHEANFDKFIKSFHK